MADSDLHLVDSSIWVDALRVKPGSNRFVELKEWVRADRVVTNPIVRLELLSGAATQQEYDRIGMMLSPLRELPLDDQAWNRAARLGFTLRRAGVTVPHTDLLIAACAIEHRCTVIHRDRHFDLIAKHSLLAEQSM